MSFDQLSHVDENGDILSSSNALQDDTMILATQSGVEAVVGDLKPDLSKSAFAGVEAAKYLLFVLAAYYNYREGYYAHAPR